ncbi:hypothetical protein [Sphingorhabdus sp. Alg239-R122]|uniref:hypothetical protein n=1 Tax=Sphingorhabdus sp. Alg239-R122 TaxID=2305989 RepID=UPI0013DB0737|nr:hypothetical protein [Sphingorhabdus sp. Alg239-R122]
MHKIIHKLPVAMAAIAMMSTPAAAQEVPSAAQDVAQAADTVGEEAAQCELHVWPSYNYLGFNSGLLSGFGPIGALADMEAHKGKVATVKDLMADYLGPDIQMAELNKVGITETLNLEGYNVIVQDPFPSADEAKEDPEIKAQLKAINKRVKDKKRLTDSDADCYAELVTTHIFYHKAMMYGSNLFTGFLYREFKGDKQGFVGKGQVKNPLEEFPPKSEDMVDAAKLELRDAYSKDFTEYVEKKVMKKKKRRK